MSGIDPPRPRGAATPPEEGTYFKFFYGEKSCCHRRGRIYWI